MKTAIMHLTALLALGTSTQANAQLTDQALARAKQLKAEIKTFRLELLYNGQEDKPFYRLVLSVPPIGYDRSNPFYRLARITESPAVKIIDHLVGEGFLDGAFDLRAKTKRPPPTMPGYVMRASTQGIAFQEDLGWGLPMLERLDGLRKVLDGDAARGMDLLLGRLSGLRREWEKESAGNWKKLYEDQAWYKNHRQPEQVFRGTLQRHREPEVSILQRPHRYKLGDRFIYPGREHPELEKLIGREVEVRGKPYDVELEGRSVREIWPAAVRAAGPSVQPDFSGLKEGITLPEAREILGSIGRLRENSMLEESIYDFDFDKRSAVLIVDRRASPAIVTKVVIWNHGKTVQEVRAERRRKWQEWVEAHSPKE